MPRRPLPPAQPSHTDLADKLSRFFKDAALYGFWFCKSCDAPCERIEGEQGQPAHCDKCGSPRISWTQPMNQLQPEGA
jgi:rubrerythrin